jgi:2-polyprenyl-3-methyl-5-hydroxy-6-metoxy-1,4-benzoquinol methylase
MTAAHPEHRYAYTVDLGDEGHAATHVVRLVGQRKTVLEIGSGPGSITRYLRDPGQCRIVAVEIDPDAAALVAPYCEAVLRIDLNDPAWTSQLGAYTDGFEVVVAADVLEHLYDPWNALRQIRGLLRQDGHVVVSLPHAGHNVVVASLLNADLEYRENGLLDRTHIRFFGMRNIQSLFEDSGFRIVDVGFVMRAPEITELAHQWQALPRNLQRSLSDNPYGCVYQVVVKAAPSRDGRKGIDLTTLTVPVVRTPRLKRSLVPLARRLAERLSPATRARLKAFLTRTGLMRRIRGSE